MSAIALSSPGGRSRRRPHPLVAAAAALGLVIVAIVSVDLLTPTHYESGSPSNASSPTGLAGYATLLQIAGHHTSTASVGPAGAALDPADSAVMLGSPRLGAADISALRRFVIAGGELITHGPAGWLAALIPSPPRWAQGGQPVANALVPVPEDTGVSQIRTTSAGVWTSAGSALPVVGNSAGSVLVLATLGSGRIALLSDPSPLQNQLLASSDDAALGLALAGPASRPIVFIVPIAGTSTSGGLAALPLRWKWLLGGLVLAALALIAARFRRLGDAAPRPPAPLPPRLAHVQALGAAIGRAADAETIATRTRERFAKQAI
jgi:hypothetical protein